MEDIEKKITEWATKALENDARYIDESGSICGIVTTDYMNDPRCMLQIGYSLCHGKPIFLLVKKGMELPPKLTQAADGIYFWEKQDDLRAGAEWLVARMRETDKEKN